MAGARQPIDLVVARGRKHLTKKEIEQRRQTEVHAPPLEGGAEPPKYLPKNLQDKFEDLARQLIDIGIFAAIDCDSLARYVIADNAYTTISSMALAAIADGDADKIDKLSRLQERYYKQCVKSAADLGLTISSRCKIIMPQKKEEEEDDAMAKMLNKRIRDKRA